MYNIYLENQNIDYIKKIVRTYDEVFTDIYQQI